MKKLVLPAAIAAIMSLSAFTAINSIDWKISTGYVINFSSEDPSGVFTSMKGDISFDENDLKSSMFNVTVDANSINTGNGMQNKKAKGAEYFDVEKYPVIKFTSKEISKTATGYETTGTLDMHGVQKQITIPFTFSNNTFKGNFEVNRIDYGVGTEGHAASVLKIAISVPVTKK